MLVFGVRDPASVLFSLSRSRTNRKKELASVSLGSFWPCPEFENSMRRKGTMNNRTFILITLLLFLAAPLFGRDKTDVLVMKNGDRMTCEVKGLNGGVLYVSFDYIDGTTSVQWSKVAHLESNQLFIVKTENGAVYTGKLNTPETPAGQPVRIQVLETPDHEVDLERTQIVKMAETSDRFWQRFNGEISSGIIYSKGNQSAQYNVASDLAYVRERWNAAANLSSSLASSTGTNVSTRNDLQLGVSRLLRWDNYFYAGLGNFLQSSVQSIRVQTTLGGGIGRYLKNTNNATISVLGGLAWQSTVYDPSITPIGQQNLGAAVIAANAKFFKFSKTNLDISAVLLPALSQPGRVHFNTNATYYVKLFSNLKWNVSFYGNWDNRPPPNFSGSDYGSSSGLSWTFGNR